jgi:hypothetical protein
LKLAPESLFLGVLSTTLLTFAAFVIDSRAVASALLWQARLFQLLVHTPDNPVHEGSPIDIFAFAFGVLLGVPIYSLLAYALLTRSRRRSRQP